MEKRTERVVVYFTPLEKRLLQRIAGLEGISVGELVRSLVLPIVEERSEAR